MPLQISLANGKLTRQSVGPTAVAALGSAIFADEAVPAASPQVAPLHPYATRANLVAALGAAAGTAYDLEQRGPFIIRAQAALDATDGVAIRCLKAGVAFPAAWLTYVQELRAIVNGSDTSSTALPSAPAYPPGS